VIVHALAMYGRERHGAQPAAIHAEHEVALCERFDRDLDMHVDESDDAGPART